MTHNPIGGWLRKEPFEPFLLVVSNGDRYEIRHTENAALLKTNLIVAQPDTDSYAELVLLHT